MRLKTTRIIIVNGNASSATDAKDKVKNNESEDPNDGNRLQNKQLRLKTTRIIIVNGNASSDGVKKSRRYGHLTKSMEDSGDCYYDEDGGELSLTMKHNKFTDTTLEDPLQTSWKSDWRQLLEEMYQLLADIVENNETGRPVS